MAAALQLSALVAARNRSYVITLLLWCWVAGLAVPAAAQAIANSTQQQNSTVSPDARYPLIVVLKDQRSLTKLPVMCGSNARVFRALARGLGLPQNCYMPGQCKRIYSFAVKGFSGDFNTADLVKLERCLPGATFYKELDGTVHKAEDDDFWHPLDAEDRIRQRQQQLQQLGWQSQQLQQEAAAQRRWQQQQGQQQLTKGRRMQQVVDVPKVESFEEKVKTPVTPDTALNLWDLTQGKNMNQPGAKQQAVNSRLWNLDRLDQRELPLDGYYTYGTPQVNGTGEGTTIYVVDSGIKIDHQEFKNDLGTRVRASYGRDFVENDDIADDCDGHGTHVSATAVGLQVGVAKEANVVAVRILDCTGSGTISNTVAGLDWVAANARKPAVVTLSLGIQVGSWSRVLEDSVRSLARNYNITVVVASGNSGVDACYVAPANVPEVITVAASNVATKYNGTRTGDPEDSYKWANTGPCVDVFAPGVDIYSACGGASRCQVVDNMSYTYASGTSMAVPHVAGVAAIYLSSNPDATPQQVSDIITNTATINKVTQSRLKPGTPNRLLYSGLNQDPPSTGPSVVTAAEGPKP
ncbi:hypothetical protein N2152v2_004896 [Parachlorella kessleri]